MYTLGVDIGSATTKCVIMKDGAEVVSKSLRRGGLGTESPQEAVAALWADTGLNQEKIEMTAVTGYGRKNYQYADGNVSELTCHALGGRWIFPDLRTLIDIGGQDAKVISMDDYGHMTNFIMNDKCAAGTGRFLEVMAGILCMGVDELDMYSAMAKNPATISNTCAVFAESEVISQLAAGADKCDLAAGICNSVASRVGALARRSGITPRVCMSGGVANNKGIRCAMERNLGTEISFDRRAQYFGAIGAAIWAWKKLR